MAELVDAKRDKEKLLEDNPKSSNIIHIGSNPILVSKFFNHLKTNFMRSIILTALLVLGSLILMGQSNEKLYCVQIMSTRNPQMFEYDKDVIDTVYLERKVINDVTWYRLMVVAYNEADQGMLHTYYSKKYGKCLMEIRDYNCLFVWQMLDRKIIY